MKRRKTIGIGEEASSTTSPGSPTGHDSGKLVLLRRIVTSNVLTSTHLGSLKNNSKDDEVQEHHEMLECNGAELGVLLDQHFLCPPLCSSNHIHIPG